MKVLVTGGAGFIGSHIVDGLILEGYDVVIVDNLSSGSEKNINKKAKFYKVNIQDSELESIFQKERPDYVSHQAAQKDVRFSVADPVFDAEVNIIGTINILQNCVKYKVKKIIFASTGGAIYGEQDVFPANESHPTRPISPYGISKLSAEHYMHFYKTCYGLDCVLLRYANVYGPKQDPLGEAGVIAIFVHNMLNGKQSVINGDGEQTRDFVYVEDVSRANILAIQNSTGDAIFNIGTGIETSINNVFNSLTNIINPTITAIHGPAKEGEQRRSVIDYKRASEILHWVPEASFLHGLEKTFCYFKTLSS